MGNTSRKTSYPKSVSSVGSDAKKARWGVGLGVPSPPGKPILVPGEEELDPDTVGIRWERSPNNGGTAIIGYIVEHRKMGSPNWVRSAPFLCTFPELILSGLDPGWRYQFRVKAQNAVGLSDPSEISDPLTVTLQRAAASPPKFETELNDTVALENDQVEFAVSFIGTPLPKISWYKDGFEIFSSRRTKIITENGRSNLLIHRIALDDEGEIKCTATNRVGHVSTRARLTLEAPPRIRLPRQYEDGLLFEQDETIRLKVSVAGRPPPIVNWYHDNELILSDSRHIFDAIDGESTMKIPDAKRQDRGEYTIRARNKLGEDITSFLVTVTDRPEPPSKAVVTMTLGRSVTLSWKEPQDDGGCKIGTYIIEYYRVGWNMWLKAATSRQTSTTLSELIEGSEYRFRVKAENPYGVSDPSDESDTIFIPDPKRGITAANMREKSQSHREIHRGRSERREVSFLEPTQRTRSLTREETTTNNKKLREHLSSSQRLNVTKPTRTDSRVTFALDTVYVDENPNPDTHLPSLEVTNERHRSPSPHKVIVTTVSDEVIIRSDLSQNTLTPFAWSNEDDLSQRTVKVKEDSMINKPSSDSKETHSTHLSIRKQTFAANRSKSADDTDTVTPLTCDEPMLHGSSEFMLVLYPDETDELPKGEKIKEDSKNTYEKEREIRDKYEIHQEQSIVTDDDEDLVPPPMSFSLPELFSANHEVIEIVREAVSSTELLHERAMERFYRAVAAEEAANEAKQKITTPSSGDDKASNTEAVGLFEMKVKPLRRRLSNSGGQSISWQVKRERRRSNDSQSDSNRTSLRLQPSAVLENAASDPNVFLNKTTEKRGTEDNYWSKSKSHADEKLKELNVNKDSDLKDQNQEISLEDRVSYSEETTEDNIDDEYLRKFKTTIITKSTMDEGDTYHPKGKPMPYKNTQELLLSTQEMHTSELSKEQHSTPQILPKSILKKRTETEHIPVNQFGRPIPPEVPLDTSTHQKGHTSSTASNKTPDILPHGNFNLMSDIEKDNATVLSAAEAAKDRRKQLKQNLNQSAESENEDQTQERMAVVSHYTEIVKEYSMAHTPFPPRPFIKQGAINTGTNTPQEEQQTSHQPPILLTSPITPSLRDVYVQEKMPSSHLMNVAKVSPVTVISGYQSLEDSNLLRNKYAVKSDVLPSRSRNVSKDSQPSSRSSSKSRVRSSRTRSPSCKTTATESRSSSQTRSKARASSRARSSSRSRSDKSDSQKSSLATMEQKLGRPQSRSASRDRLRARIPNDINREHYQTFSESRKSSTRSNLSHSNNRNVEDELEAMTNNNYVTQIQADINVRKIISYVTDISLLLAAVYVYVFKREIFALPFIVLLLYRHIQYEIKSMLPKWVMQTPKS